MVEKKRPSKNRHFRILIKMETIYIDKLPRVTRNRKKLERILNVKITNEGKNVTIEGTPEAEYTARKVIDSLEFGFPFSVAMMIKKNDYEFEFLNIKDYTPKKNMSRIKARIIGTQGQTLKTLSELTKCFFEIKDNQVGIVGHPEYIKNAQDAVIQIIQGSKQGNVYAWLEKNQVKPIIDLGLKKPKSKKE